MNHYTKGFIACFACGIGIGPGYAETLPSKVGDKTLCGFCHGKLKLQGYIQLDSFRRLLPDGSVIKFYQKVSDETGEDQNSPVAC